MIDKEIIEYKKYQVGGESFRVITHYKRDDLEWWSDFDDNGNEIHFRCNNGFEYWRSWKYDAKEMKWALDIYRDESGNRYNPKDGWYHITSNGGIHMGVVK